MFLLSDEGVGKLLMSLSLIEQIIKDASRMCISFSVRHLMIIWGAPPCLIFGLTLIWVGDNFSPVGFPLITQKQ